MADDAVALLDHLKIDTAHIVGASMGGMIAQTMALHFPERVRTLTSIMSSTGDPSLPPPSAEAMGILMNPPPAERDAYLAHEVEVWHALNGPGYPVDEERVRELAGRIFDRGLSPEGTARQLAAILASGSRREALKTLTVPTLVIHGDADPLVPVAHGRDTAEAVPGAELLIIEGMGHELPRHAWPRIVAAIAAHTRKAEAR